MASTLRDALLDEVRDLYHAEKQLVKALPKLAKGASNPDLREALEAHLDETEQQVSRLEQVFEHLGEPARAKTCAGMAGIIEEGAETLGKDLDGAVMDAAIVAAAQRAEHYEMAAYGTAAAWAEALGLPEVAALLIETLEEERAADEKLTALAEEGLNEAAADETDEADGGREAGEGGADDEEEDGAAAGARGTTSPGRTRKASGRKR